MPSEVAVEMQQELELAPEIERRSLMEVRVRVRVRVRVISGAPPRSSGDRSWRSSSAPCSHPNPNPNANPNANAKPNPEP